MPYQYINLTRSRIDSFHCPINLKESFLWDTLQPGFGLRAFATGKKSYVFRATVNGKTRRGVIGDASGDLGSARDEARRLKTLADQGISPSEDKNLRKSKQKSQNLIDKRSQITLETVWESYLKANKLNWSERYYIDHCKAMQEPDLPCGRGLSSKTREGALWALRGTRIADISPQLLTSWLTLERDSRPGVAALCYRMLMACLNWSTEHPLYTGLVDITKVKTRQLQRHVPSLNPRTDVLESSQLASWFCEVKKIENPIISAFVQCLLITGARRGELENLKWEDVSFQWNMLTIRDKATTRGQVIGTRSIPLTPYVSDLLQLLPRRNQWVFSSPTSTTGKLKEPRKSIDPAFKAAGLEGLTLHGLRRSFSTLSEWVEVPAGITAQIMGHKPSAISEKHYKQRPLDLLRMWHTRFEVWILEQTKQVS